MLFLVFLLTVDFVSKDMVFKPLIKSKNNICTNSKKYTLTMNKN